VSLVNAAWALCAVLGTQLSERLQLRVLMFERVRSRPSPGAWSNARSGCLTGDSEECRTARAVTQPSCVCLCSSSTPPKALPATIVCKCPGTRTGKTVDRHKSQRTRGGPGSQGRSALTTGSPGVASIVAGPPCEHVPVGAVLSLLPIGRSRALRADLSRNLRAHINDTSRLPRNALVVQSEAPSITAAMTSAKSPPTSPVRRGPSPS